MSIHPLPPPSVGSIVMVISVVGMRVGSVVGMVTNVGIVMVGSLVGIVEEISVGTVVGTEVGSGVTIFVGTRVGTVVGSGVGIVVVSVTVGFTYSPGSTADTGMVQTAHSIRIMIIMKNLLFTISLPVL